MEYVGAGFILFAICAAVCSVIRKEREGRREGEDIRASIDVTKLQRILGPALLLGKENLEDPGVKELVCSRYRHQLDHDVTELPPLVAIAEQVLEKYPHASPGKGPYALAEWLYYLCGPEGAERQLKHLLEEGPTEPQFYIAARQRAAELGITAEEVLEQDMEHFRAFLERSSDCLEPHEIEQMVNGESLGPDRLEHARNCPCCRLWLKEEAPPVV